MHGRIQCGVTKSVVTLAFAVVAVLVPSARPDDGPSRGESTSVDHGKKGGNV